MKILITGGSGLLGSELRKLLPTALIPSKDDLDIGDAENVYDFLTDNDIDFVIHCAGFMPPAKAEELPQGALHTNIIGTCYVTAVCIARNIPLIYISTDYVFDGKKGNYKETDPVLPLSNYAWSKLGGECAVRLHKKGLVVRTSFGAKEYAFDRAFVDQWTSKERVDVIAKKIVSLIGKDIYGVIHLGGDRKTVYEYAKEVSPNKNIEESHMPKDDGYIRPVDTSLNTSKFRSLKKLRGWNKFASLVVNGKVEKYL